MANFTLPNIDYTIIGQSEQNYFHVDVVGFWATPITIEVMRRRNGTWECEVSHSSGGKDGTDNLGAEENFANAILESIKLARNIEKNSATLEANYQQQLIANEEKWAAAQAEKEAKIEADPELGVEGAKKLIDELKSFKPGTCVIKVYSRGTNYSCKEIYVTDTGRFAYKMYGKQELLSKAELVTYLSQMSQRSYIIRK